jgi:glycosyltransferase involved in cell wall biosynthesis
VSLERFDIISKKEARGLLEWMDEDRVVLFNAGKGRGGKRLDLAQEAVKVAHTYINNFRFVVLDGNVPPGKVPILMNAADCLLMTSDYEGSPNVVKEAMACNLPVVAVNVGDVPERLRDVQPSRIVTRDPQALGQAIADILKLNCRSNGRVIVKRDASEIVINKRTLDVYLAALKK